MYEKIETNDEGDISMRNVITHIQIEELAEKWSDHQTNCNYKHSACGILSLNRQIMIYCQSLSCQIMI